MSIRQTYNKKILEYLAARIDKYPNLSFIELLHKVGLAPFEVEGHKSRVHEESQLTFIKLLAHQERQNTNET